MSTNTLHGITARTPLELLVDAGVIVRNYVPLTALASCDIVGATDGGIKINVKPEVHSPGIDGAYAPVKGTERLTKFDCNIEATLVSVELAAMTDVMLGSGFVNLAAAPTTHYDITPGLLTVADYYDNIAVLVTHSSNPLLPAGAVFMLLNARTDGNLQVGTKHGDEGSFPIHYEATVLPTDPQTAPWRILYPKVAGEELS